MISLKDGLTLAVRNIFLPQPHEIMFFGDIFQIDPDLLIHMWKTKLIVSLFKSPKFSCK